MRSEHQAWIKNYTTAVLTFLLIVLLFATFKGGEIVGARKAKFSCRWAENYNRNFGGPRDSFLHNVINRPSFTAHGIFGSILKIDNNSLVIKNQQDVEMIVVVNANTTINRWRQAILLGDLRVGEKITIIGSPNERGQIEARFIRVFPN